jgi:hypothetical protein
VSERYGFRIALDRHWSEDDATVDWDGEALQGLSTPAFVTFSDPRTGRTFVAAAAPTGKGTTLASWRAAMAAAAPTVCSNASTVTRTVLGGEPALAWAATCSDGYDVENVATLHGRRGYVAFLASPTGLDDAGDRRVFESIRRSFRFDGAP